VTNKKLTNSLVFLPAQSRQAIAIQPNLNGVIHPEAKMLAASAGDADEDDSMMWLGCGLLPDDSLSMLHAYTSTHGACLWT